MKELGARYNSGKPEWGLVDWEVVEDMVRVLEFGKKKYAAWNWAKGIYYVKTIESLLRHSFAILRGEEKDSESGLPHYAHIMCNAMFLGRMMKSRPDMDDRYFKKNLKFNNNGHVNEKTGR